MDFYFLNMILVEAVAHVGDLVILLLLPYALLVTVITFCALVPSSGARSGVRLVFRLSVFAP